MMTQQDFTLCCNCRNTTQCLFESRGKKPLLFCDLFEIEEPKCGGACGEKKRPSAANRVRDAAPASEERKYLGLCSDCENRSTCILVRKSDGGVWHCEEYV